MPTHDEVNGSVRAWRWHHAGLVVPDLDEAIAFYSTALGYAVEFEVRGMAEQFARTVGVTGIRCDLAQLVSPLSDVRLELVRTYDVPPGLDPRLPVHVGVGHGAYVVDDLDAALAALEAAGGRAMGEVVEFDEGPAVYCWSPSGTVVELEGRDGCQRN